ncbi:MAG: cytochrome c3 family protein [Planctomycetota bacterium]|nr:cytochrome c3 family protein [Planctomycetota bacterium]
MQRMIVTVILVVGLGFSLMVLASGVGLWHLPDNQQGYSPPQPIDYSHRLHAGELNINCRFCHSGAWESRHAGIPSTDVCMKCHKFVTDSFDVMQAELKRAGDAKEKPQTMVSDELRKLYDAFGLDKDLKPIDGVEPKSIPWVRVHNLPDYVRFSHKAHVTAGVSCQHCHGPVESMERMSQFSSLSMGWCVDCHRESTEAGINGKQVHASTDCSVCHH